MVTIQKEFLTPQEVAQMLMVSPVTVRQWAQRGWLKAEVTAGGHRRFLRATIEEFAQQRGLTLLRPRSPGLRVLIVDDDEALAGYLAELLQGQARPVFTDIARDGFEAGQKVQLFQPDVVLLDLRMPGLDGFEVCRRLRNDPATHGTRIVAMTGYYTKDNVRRAIEAGAEECLRKPIDVERLLATLGLAERRVVAERS